MRIGVRVIGGLVHILGFAEREIEAPSGTTAAGLLDLLGLRSRSVITTRDGIGLGPDEALAEGDRLLISPPFSGG